MEKILNGLIKIAMIPTLALSLNSCNNKKADLPPMEEMIFLQKDFDGSTLLFKKFRNGGSAFYRDKDNDGYMDSFGTYPDYTNPSIFITEIKEYDFPFTNLNGRVKILELKKKFEKQYLHLQNKK